MSAQTYSGNGLVLKVNVSDIYGDGCVVTGNGNSVMGDGCTVRGNNNLVTGDNCRTYGKNNRVTGRNSRSYGGGHTQASGPGSRAIKVTKRHVVRSGTRATVGPSSSYSVGGNATVGAIGSGVRGAVTVTLPNGDRVTNSSETVVLSGGGDSWCTPDGDHISGSGTTVVTDGVYHESAESADVEEMHVVEVETPASSVEEDWKTELPDLPPGGRKVLEEQEVTPALVRTFDTKTELKQFLGELEGLQIGSRVLLLRYWGRHHGEVPKTSHKRAREETHVIVDARGHTGGVVAHTLGDVTQVNRTTSTTSSTSRQYDSGSLTTGTDRGNVYALGGGTGGGITCARTTGDINIPPGSSVTFIGDTLTWRLPGGGCSVVGDCSGARSINGLSVATFRSMHDTSS